MKKTYIWYFLASFCGLIVALYAGIHDISKLTTGAGCMCCWLFGMGISQYFKYKKEEGQA